MKWIKSSVNSGVNFGVNSGVNSGVVCFYQVTHRVKVSSRLLLFQGGGVASKMFGEKIE